MRTAFITLLLLLTPVIAHAGRAEPPPLIESLQKGYGVVAVSLVEEKPTGENGVRSMHFRVEKLVAAPTAGGQLPAKEGDVITVPISIGYGAELERWGHDQPFAAGDKFLLILHINATTGDYEGLQYSGAVRPVKAFDPIQLRSIGRIRDLAAAKPADRFGMARQIIGEDKDADDELIYASYAVLRGIKDLAERAATIAFLREQWKRAAITTPYSRLYTIDETLRAVDPAFTAGSDERLDGWFRVLFAPFAAKGDPRAWDALNSHLLPFQLRELGKAAPDKVAGRVIREMHDREWPLQYRWRLAGVLQTLYQSAANENPAWDAELQSFFPAAFAEAGGWELRLLPSSIEHGLKPPQYDIKRSFIAAPDTWDAMAAALARMEAFVKERPKDDNARSAVFELRNALKLRPDLKKNPQ